jgi:hypothetical protein
MFSVLCQVSARILDETISKGVVLQIRACTGNYNRRKRAVRNFAPGSHSALMYKRSNQVVQGRSEAEVSRHCQQQAASIGLSNDGFHHVFPLVGGLAKRGVWLWIWSSVLVTLSSGLYVRPSLSMLFNHVIHSLHI